MFSRFKSKVSGETKANTTDTPPPPPTVSTDASAPKSGFAASFSSFAGKARKSSGNIAAGLGKGIKTAASSAKGGIIAVSETVDSATKKVLEKQISKASPTSKTFHVLKQMNTWREQSKLALLYTLELPSNLSRDLVVASLLSGGTPPNYVCEWINDQSDRKHSRKSDIKATNWLCKSLDTAHIAPGVKNAAIELLSVKSFTTTLSSREQYLPLKNHCEKSLLKIGAHLDAFYKEEDLYQKLHLHPQEKKLLPLHPATSDGICSLKRQDHPEVGLVHPAHSSDYNKVEWECFEEESVYIHVLRLAALAIDKSYQQIIKEIATNATVGGTLKEYTFSPASIKGDARIRSKALSQDDHANDSRPRPAQNIDVNRNCLTFDTAEELLAAASDICKHPAFGGGAARLKNGFALDQKEAKKAFHYRTVMLNMLYDAGTTYGELSEREDVAKLWNTYVEAPAENPRQSWTTWRKHAMAAVTHLRSETMKDRPVKLIVESQLLLKEYKDGRDHMHLLYKVARTDSDKALYSQFAGGGKKKKPDPKGVTWLSEEQKSLSELTIQLQKLEEKKDVTEEKEEEAEENTSAEEKIGVLLRSACVEGWKSSVDALLATEIFLSQPDIVNSVGKVERANVQTEGARMAIQSHNMLFYPGLLGLPNAGKCFACGEMKLSRNCKNCHLCSNCCSNEYCVPCCVPCRWCKENIDDKHTFHEHECCTPSVRQWCESKKKQQKKDEEAAAEAAAEAEKGEVKDEEKKEKEQEKELSPRKSFVSVVKMFKKEKKEKVVQTAQQKEDASKTSLYLACEEGHVDVVASLLKVGLTAVNKCAVDGMTPLLVSISGGHESIVRMLLAHDGIDVNVSKGLGNFAIGSKCNAELNEMTPLIAACYFGYDSIVRMLLQHPTIEITREMSNRDASSAASERSTKSALVVACERGQLAVVMLLLQYDQENKLDLVNGATVSPLFAASMNGHAHVVKLLLSHPCNTGAAFINKPNPTNNMTPLVAASMHGHEEVAHMLLEQPGIDLSAQCTEVDNGKKLTCLIAASKIGNKPIVEKILEIVEKNSPEMDLFKARDSSKRMGRSGGRNALNAMIWANDKKNMPLMKATTIVSKGSDPDYPAVKVMLMEAQAKTKDAARYAAETEQEEEAKKEEVKEEKEKEMRNQEELKRALEEEMEVVEGEESK